MWKLVVLSCTLLLSTQVAGEPPYEPYGRISLRLPQHTPSDDSRIVDQRLLDRVADIISQGGDGSERGAQENEAYSVVGEDLFARIARIISQNEGQSPPAEPNPSGPVITPDYGVPSDFSTKLVGVGELELGKPFRAMRIASFELTDDNYLGGQGQGDGYAADASGYPAQRMFERIQYLSPPEISNRIAAFEIPETGEPQVNKPGYR